MAFSPFINHIFILWNNFPKLTVGIFYSFKNQTDSKNPKSKQTKPQTCNVSLVCRGETLKTSSWYARLSVFWPLLLLPVSHLFPVCNFHFKHMDLFLAYEHSVFLPLALVSSFCQECLPFYFSKIAYF